MTDTTKGLTTTEAINLQKKYGKNEIAPRKKPNFFKKVLSVISEPMFLLLLIAATIYFILGEPTDATVLLIFVLAIISIEIIQEWRTDKTLEKLKDLSAPVITVIRNSKPTQIKSTDLVPGDIMLIHEGIKIPADGTILESHDLNVDESSLTGESEGVWKVATDSQKAQSQPQTDYWRKDYCYAGTLVLQGSATVEVNQIGLHTEHGKISQNVASAPEEKTPLQNQTAKLVRLCAIIAAVLFLLVSIATWFNSANLTTGNRLIDSLLSGIALAMAMIPEEFPVILTVFLSLGAWRLAKQKSLVRRLPAVETLGEISVLCVDKTGTITLNQMTVEQTWTAHTTVKQFATTLALACETDAYDPMEKAMLTYCQQTGINPQKLHQNQLLTEYPFTNQLKMMGHVWQQNQKITIAAKGSPEQILKLCHLTAKQRQQVDTELQSMRDQSLRVIAVATAQPKTTAQVPKELQKATLTLSGLVGLADPPRPSIKKDIASCYRAGIHVVMITGDNGTTASSIAKRIGMRDTDNIITGQDLDQMTDQQLKEKVKTVTIFSRVIPEHKMRIVKAFKASGQIVAMTGDGVNDAPALKYADIGIAMGGRGSEVSREAADLILLDDNFQTIVHTIKDGRRIYDNIQKAIGYVFTIHIPIALTALLAPILGIEHASLMLLPLHVVLLELILDPTCSIVLERQPAESNIMDRPPRNPKAKIVTAKLLLKSILQGLTIFAASFAIYYFTLEKSPDNAPLARAMGLATIMLANLFLVQVNSSSTKSALSMLKRLSKDKLMWAINILTVLLLIVSLYTPANQFLRLAPLNSLQLLVVIGLAAISTLWYDLIKLFRQLLHSNADRHS